MADDLAAEQNLQADATAFHADISAVEVAIPRERLKAYEAEVFADSKIEVVRIGDRLERGNGSAFAALTDEQKSRHAAFERLIVAHDKLDAAQAALSVAEHEAAEAERAVDA